MKTFEEYLQGHFLKEEYSGDKEHYENAFDSWCENLDVQELIDFSDMYGNYKYMEAMEKCFPKIDLLKEKIWNLRHQGENPTNDNLLEKWYLGHTKCLHEVIEIIENL